MGDTAVRPVAHAAAGTSSPGHAAGVVPQLPCGAVVFSPQAKLRQLQRLGGRIYACGPSMEHFKVAEADLAFDDVIVAEYLTFMEQMDAADIHVYS